MWLSSAHAAEKLHSECRRTDLSGETIAELLQRVGGRLADVRVFVNQPDDNDALCELRAAVRFFFFSFFCSQDR